MFSLYTTTFLPNCSEGFFQRSSHVLFLTQYFYPFSHFPSLNFYYLVRKCLTLFVSWGIYLHFYLLLIWFLFVFSFRRFLPSSILYFIFIFVLFTLSFFSFMFCFLVILIFSALSFILPLFSVPFHCGHKLLNPRSLQVTSFILFVSSPHALTSHPLLRMFPDHTIQQQTWSLTTKHFRSVSCL